MRQIRWVTTSRGGPYGTGMGGRIIQNFKPGSSTAYPLNVMNRLKKVRDLGLLTGEWLDCGCADGGYTAALRDLGAEGVVGVDPQMERIVRAREREQTHPSIRFLCASAESLPFPEASFDGVLLNEVLEHVIEEVKQLREVHLGLLPV